MKTLAAFLSAALAAATAGAGALAQPTDWGTPGSAQEARRTVRITLSDDLRVSPAIIEVGHGETVRFEVRNAGTSAHELAIGTRQSLQEQAARKGVRVVAGGLPPWATRLAPGEVGTIVWNFSRVGTFHFGCPLDGHFAAGMAGQIRVVEPAGHKH